MTATHMRYARICAARIATQKSEVALAEYCNVSKSSVERALAWGRRQNLFVLDSQEKLKMYLLDLADKRQLLEDALRLSARRPRGLSVQDEEMWKPHGGSISALARAYLDYSTRMLELEGLYRQVVNIQHSGMVEVKGYVSISPDDWDDPQLSPS